MTTKFSGGNRGFTFIELIIVLSIIGLLLSLAVPRYFHSVDKANEAVLKSNLDATRAAIDKYFADKGAYPDKLEQLVADGYLNKLPYDPIVDSTTQWVIIAPSNGEKGSVYSISSSSEALSSKADPFAKW